MAEQFAPRARRRRHRVGRRPIEKAVERARRPRRRPRRRARPPVARRVGRRRSVQAAAALAALPGREVPLRAAARQRARRARPRAHARLPPGPGHARRRPRRTTPTRGARCPRSRASTPPASSTPPPRAASDTLVLLGADPIADFPDRIRMRAGARRGARSWSRWARSPPTRPTRADVFLPTSVWGEKAGTTTNLKGRVMRLGAVHHARGHHHGGLAHRLRSWRARFGAEFGFETFEDVQDEIARVAARARGVDAELVRRARDGRCSRSPTSPTRSCSSTCSGSPPDARGSRSRPASRPTSRISRHWAPARSPPAAPAPTS